MKASALGFKQVILRYEMFRYEIECIVGPKKNVGKYVSFHLSDDGNRDNYEIKDQRGRFYYSKDRAPILWIPRFPSKPLDYGAVVHEVTHAVVDMLDYIGCEYGADGDETLAYAIDYGVTKILEARRGR